MQSNTKIHIPKKPWSLPNGEICKYLLTESATGLSTGEAQTRVYQFGLNQLHETEKKNILEILLNQFKSLIVLLLGIAALVSFGFHEIMEGFAILAVIVINGLIGFFTELRAVRSMEALKKLGSVRSKVRRNSNLEEVDAERLVPGDIVILEGGDIVTADLRLITASKLQANESSLTGESVPVDKTIQLVKEETPLAERSNILYKGTAITRGAAEGIVIHTGMQTELGQISSLVEKAEEETTPLEKRLNQLGHKLIWVTLVIALLITLSGIFTGKELFLMIETGIALAVAAIPEGLPIVATIALARGMWRMARKNGLINRLSAVETLGATTVICTDKTGTLTENKMTVTRILIDSEEIEIKWNQPGKQSRFTSQGKKSNPKSTKLLQTMLQIGALCNNGSIGGNTAVGDPLEVALLRAAAAADIRQPDLLKDFPKAGEDAFDSDIKMMATFHQHKNHVLVAVKGAPEEVIKASSKLLTHRGAIKLTNQHRKEWLEKNESMGKEGLRVLALAKKETGSVRSKPYQNLTLLGLVGLLDPPRKDVKAAIETCHHAGIQVIMITGDQPVTAQNIGQTLGLVSGPTQKVIHGQFLKSPKELTPLEKKKLLQTSLFARVSPKQKLDLVDLHQKAGAVVAMTGDGVNDAPALKEADIGIAMGLRGTQVAREAADMVLKDDRFSTIVNAIEQGRIIFNNIRKSILYLLSCNISEVMTVGLASLVNAPLPILPLQILFLNLVTDVFPALALGVGEGDPNIMKQPPRNPKEPIITKHHWWFTAGYGFIITIAVLGALAIATVCFKMDQQRAISTSFLTLAFSQLFHVFNMRDKGSRFFRNEITRNRYIWGALILCTSLLLAACFIPGLSIVLKVVNPGIKGWFLIMGMSLIPWLVGQIMKIKRK